MNKEHRELYSYLNALGTAKTKILLTCADELVYVCYPIGYCEEMPVMDGEEELWLDGYRFKFAEEFQELIDLGFDRTVVPFRDIVKIEIFDEVYGSKGEEILEQSEQKESATA